MIILMKYKGIIKRLIMEVWHQNYRFIATSIRGQKEVHIVLQTGDITGTH